MPKNEAKKKKKKPGGQTKYKARYVEEMMRFFDDYGENGEKGIPLMEDFAGRIGVTARTLQNWSREHPKFGDAYEKCMDKQMKLLVNGGLTGEFVPKMASLLLNARHRVIEHRTILLEKEKDGELETIRLEDL